MSVDEAEANYEAARAALDAFEEKQNATLAALRDERVAVNLAYRAADEALLVAHREAHPSDPALTQTVEG